MSQLWFVIVGSASARQAAPLQGIAVTGLIRDAVAEYTLTQTYVNPLPNAAIQAAYTFPLYEGVAVVGFQAEVDGRKILGKVREKAAAREEYQEAVRAGKTVSLLEQEKPDVFQACIGNIPPGKTISIRITLVSEIKQDAGENQVRFVLPTTVAPRYGQNYNYSPFGNTHFRGFGFTNPNSPVSSSSKLSVNMACAMSTPITSVQSPSHTMEVHIGRTETLDSSDSFAYDPNRARVSLTVDSLLDRDLVIIVQSRGLDQPRALVERHPTDQTHAISLTFQPRFALQPLRASELVFLVDRSESMRGEQIKQAGAALELFLRSIPFENHYFNVIGFGSTHSALFWRSVEYNADSLQMGVHYAQTMKADMGGTEIASAFQEVFQRRRGDVPTQIFLLTDGQIWNVEQLARSISNAVDDGERRNSPLRVFSLGVGDSVSHHLVESVARAGGGYAQLVMAGERMEKKVLNMLKAGLTPPVTNTAVKWSDSIADDFVMVAGGDGDEGAATENKNAASRPLINLFSESLVMVSENSTPPPEISVAIQQAPFKLPAPCRGARFTIYAILSPTTPLPKDLVLRGDSPDGPVELRVKIESVAEGETMLHSLAACALVRDLEEGSSHIHALGKTLTGRDEEMLKPLGVHVARREGQKRSDFLPLSFSHVTELLKQKIVDIGVKYNLSTKYTSWVAIDEEGPRSAAGSYIDNVAQCAPRFGQWTSTEFGSTSLFGQATPAVSFAAPQAFPPGGVFAQQPVSSRIPFDATTSGLFGCSTPAFGAQPQPSFVQFGAIASAATQAPTFGATQAPTFGATQAPAFGATQASPFGATQAPAFGATQAPAFGATQAPAFGATQAPAFGATQASPFGATQAPAFGATQAPAFGATQASLFGATQAPAFGATQAPAFGATQASPFGATQAPAFGATQAPAFGATQAPAFGATQAPAFGATQAPAFGATQAPAFGATQAPAFGATQAPAFGATQASLFGATQAPAFGATQAPAFGATQASPFGASSFGSHHGMPQQIDVMGTDDLCEQQVLRGGDQAATSSSEGHELLRSILQHQSFDGLFTLVPAIGALFVPSVDKTHLGDLRRHCTGSVELTEQQWEAIWTTCLAVEFIKAKLKGLRDEWELVVEKAERRVESLLKNSEHLARFKTAAESYLKYVPSKIC